MILGVEVEEASTIRLNACKRKESSRSGAIDDVCTSCSSFTESFLDVFHSLPVRMSRIIQRASGHFGLTNDGPLKIAKR